jgi:hypothetical protein
MCQRPLQFTLVVAMLLAGSPVFEATTGDSVGPSLVVIAQSVSSVPVTVQPPTPVDIVLFSADATGKVLTTTNQKGEGTIDGGALGNLGRLEMIEETCGPRKRVLLVAPKSKAPEGRQCELRKIGSFASGQDKALKAELFTALPRAAAIPDPPPSQPVASAQKTSAPPAAPAVHTPATTAKAGSSCPPGASMVGAKLDLAPEANSFEKAPLLVPCVYRGTEDTNQNEWKYYRIQVEAGQTVKITARLRDADLPPRPSLPNFGGYLQLLHIRLHDSNVGQVGQTQTVSEPSETCELEYKFKESGSVFVSMRWVVRDAAFLISVH